MNMTIPAECHSDDYIIEAQFDAEPWFLQASDEEITQLARCEWRGDYPADAVAMFMADKSDLVGDVFKYVELVAHRKNSPGFECSVDPQAALNWIREHRPHLAAGLCCGD
jgi:hypothetical protein